MLNTLSGIHPWHSIPPGKNLPEIVTGVIEIPKGSHNKYEIDKDTGMLVLDRVMTSSVFYPTNYGFIPQTYCEDGDALDILVLGQDIIPPLCLVHARVLGALKMLDGGEEDDKILAVNDTDPHFKHIHSLEQLSPHLLKEIENFFKTYKALENKTVSIKGWVDKNNALNIVQSAVNLYSSHKEKLFPAKL